MKTFTSKVRIHYKSYYIDLALNFLFYIESHLPTDKKITLTIEHFSIQEQTNFLCFESS
jgi:hypothetical protein